MGFFIVFEIDMRGYKMIQYNKSPNLVINTYYLLFFLMGLPFITY